MKLKKLKLKNFCKFTNFEIEFNGKITRLVGLTGSGKSTVGLTAIWAGLRGIAERAKQGQMPGERFLFIGNNGKSADIEIEFTDEKKHINIIAKNHMTTASNKITFTSSGPLTINEEWLRRFFNTAFLSAKYFSSLTSKEQSLALGIDTDQFDKTIARLKEEYTLINRDLKKLGEIEPVEKVEPVDVSELMNNRQEIEASNSCQDDRIKAINEQKTTIDGWVGVIEEAIAQIIRLKKEVQHAEEEIEATKGLIAKLPIPLKKMSFDKIDEQIKESYATNNKAKYYQDYLENVTESDKIKSQLEENKDLQSVENKKRIEYIKQKKLPFSDLSVDEKGDLLLKNRPIKSPYFSKGELEIIIVKLYSSLFGDNDDALKTRFIDDLDLLDEPNQKKLIDGLLEKGFQIITAEVGNKSKENSIVLRECKIAKKESSEPEIF